MGKQRKADQKKRLAPLHFGQEFQREYERERLRQQFAFRRSRSKQ